MPLRDLTSSEEKIVLECLKASAEGPFFEDWEFHALFGLSRDEVREVVKRWPLEDEADQKATLAINNAINNLLGYPHGCEEVWLDYISVPREEVEAIYEKWHNKRTSGYFGSMM